MTAATARTTPVLHAEPYPAHREADVVLADGSTVHVRPVRAEDEPRLLAFLRSLSTEAAALRFFTAAADLEGAARRESRVDYCRECGLVATTGAEEAIVAHGGYFASGPSQAEFALAVADRYQGHGLGTLLLGHLAEMAAANGIGVLEAEVLPENHRMLDVLRRSGFAPQVHSEAGVLHVAFPTSFTEEALVQFEQREQLAAASALRTILAPRSIAVIGASRRHDAVGGALFRNLLAAEFAGPVYPVNPAADVVHCVPAYPTVEAIPGPVDLAVVAIPAAGVLDAAEQCGRKGVRALVVVSAGFGEAGEAGRNRQADLLRVCRTYGMRLIGPNCVGVANTDPAVRLHATFGPLAPEPGSVGLASQSGALGLAAIDYARRLGLGLSSVVSMGNKADMSGNDLLSYWESDPRTRVILLYLESFGNPRKFARIARRVGRTKPIVVVKSGRSAAGARATSSHTGALLAASDVTVDALFRQSGVIRTDTLAELFDVAALLAHQPVPAGRRVAIVTNVGGPAILCADAAESLGLQLPVLSEETQATLRSFLPAEASASNPVDMLATATAEHYRHAIAAVAADPQIDAVIAIFLPPLVTRAEDVAAALAAAAGELGGRKPLLAVFTTADEPPAALAVAQPRVPVYQFAEAAAAALAHAARYGEWRSRPLAIPAQLSDLRRDEAAALVSRSLGRLGDEGGWLLPEEVGALFACYGLPLVEQRLAATPQAAAGVAAAFAGEVAVKAVVPGLVHKTEAGAVRLHVPVADAGRVAAEMVEQLTAAGTPPSGFLLQPMIAPGVEMIAGVVHDPHFGPVVACGAGGVIVELLKDVAVRLTPLAPAEAAEMVHELRMFPLLDGFRGRPLGDLAALDDALVRLAALAEDRPEVVELDCNPLVVLPRGQGVSIVDARVRIAPSAPPRPLSARR